MTEQEVIQSIKSINLQIIYYLFGNDNEPPGMEEVPSQEDVSDVYINNNIYLTQSTIFHQDSAMVDLHVKLDKAIGKNSSVIDIGCESGVTGLLLAHQGRNVTFYDYDSIGLRFVKWYLDKLHLPGKVKTYGENVHKHNWALALDVIEHSGDPLSFLKWMEQLGENVIITYPLTIDWTPPYLPAQVDSWVDDLAVVNIVKARYNLMFCEKVNGRRFLGYHTKGTKWT